MIAVGRWISVDQPNGWQELAKDFSWLSEQAIAHDQLIKAVAKINTVIPFKIGSFFSSQELLVESLAPHEAHFLNQLEQLQGQEEWSVKLYADPKALHLPETANSSIYTDLEKELEQASEGKAFLLRKKIQKLKAQDQSQSLAQYIELLCAGLEKYSSSLVITPSLSPELTGKAKKMLLNTALLIPQGHQAFSEYLQSEQEKWKQWGIELAVSGPWPPYHFTQSPQGL